MNNPKVSVIIPAFRDWGRLLLCLNALTNQSYPSENLEIWVVNNDPSDPVPAGFNIPDNCKIIFEAKSGSYAARNAALKLATGEILGFTDSDCIPDKDWVLNAVKFLSSNPDFKRIGGRIKLFYKSENLTLAEVYEKVYAFKQDFAVSKGISVTANMFTYRSVFDKVGEFNASLMSGGDNEWSKRALSAGFNIAYVPEVVIKHPARYAMSELTKKEKRVAGNIGSNKPKALKNLFKYMIPPVGAFLQKEKLTITERFKIFGIRYYLNLVRSVEGVNVAFGKSANRE